METPYSTDQTSSSRPHQIKCSEITLGTAWGIDHARRMLGVVVIVAYRPKTGKAEETLSIVRERVPFLRKEGLVTDRAPVIMRARDGTIIEVSEWKSREAIDAAHKNKNVWSLWNRFFDVCDCIPLKDLAEAQEMFAGFEPIDD